MSDKAPTTKGTQSKSKSANSKSKQRLKELVLTTLAAGGVLSIAGWEAQAHGNRSSQGVAEPAAPQDDKEKSDTRSKSDSKPKPKSDSESSTKK